MRFSLRDEALRARECEIYFYNSLSMDGELFENSIQKKKVV